MQELSDARQALEAARAAGGEQFSPEALEHAERQLARASSSLSAGDYREARRAAVTAKRYAVMARQTTLSVQTVE